MKAPIRILSPTFEFLCEIDDYEQLMIQRNLSSFGDIEVVIDKSKVNTEHFQLGNLMVIDQNRAGFIDYIEVIQDTSFEKMVVKGFTLERMLNYFVAFPPTGQAEWIMNAPVETVIKSLITDNFNRCQVKEIVVAPNLGRGESVEFKTAYKPLDEEVKAICDGQKVGIQITCDLTIKHFLLDVVMGKDLTTNQRDNPPVIFASDFDNVLDAKLINSTIDYRNTAITGGKGEGVNREIITLYEDDKVVMGLNRREVFVDVRDSETTSQMLPDKGKERLKELKPVLTLDGKINPYHSVQFGKDYNLGDMVTMKYANATLHTQITAVSESWDADGYSLESTFGDKLPTLIDKIKKGVKP